MAVVCNYSNANEIKKRSLVAKERRALFTADPSKPTGTINIGYNLLKLPQTITGAKPLPIRIMPAGKSFGG